MALVSALGVSPLAAADDSARKLESAERTVVAEGAAWSMVVALSDGSLGLVIREEQLVKEAGCDVFDKG